MKNLQQALESFGSELARYMKLNLGAKRTKTGRRSTWKKIGKGQWKPKTTKTRKYRANSVASGKLQKSIRHKVVGSKVQISMLEYGQFVEKGRMPKSKMAPPSAIKQWTRNKKLKFRDLKTGKFKSETRSSRDGMAFAINRSIAYFGIEPFPFQLQALERAYKEHKENIMEAIKKDLQDGIND